MIQIQSRCVCSVTLPWPFQRRNLERHFLTVHRSYANVSTVKSSLPTEKVNGLRRGSAPASATSPTKMTPPSRWGPKPVVPHHTSGPNQKQRITYTFSSDSEENEKEEMKISKMRSQQSPRMKPRKLFRSLIEGIEAEVSHVTSGSHTMNSTQWDAEAGDEDSEAVVNPSSLCRHFGSELKKKIEGRSKLMEVYNKQSLNAVQLHVSSLKEQIHKYRAQRLEKTGRMLLEEIPKLEEDEAVLKKMEKDHAVYWKKQSVTFRSHLQQCTSRLEVFKKGLQSNVCNSTEFEERTFSAQMCLIRKDMRSLQDKLLSEMQEGEIQSMKRGLHALFYPGGARF